MVKFTSAAALLSVLRQHGCRASPLLRSGRDEERKLQSFDENGPRSSPLNYGSYVDKILEPEYEYNGRVCYNDMFSTKSGGPTTAQFLAMFNDNFVEHSGGIYVAPPQGYYPALTRGLYDVTDLPETSCVMFGLLYQDATIGQIVASPRFDPIQIIGVSGTTIYGYYVDPNSGSWTRTPTVWGDAKDGSLSADPTDHGVVTGLSTNDRMFTLWGSFNPNIPNGNNFNYAKEDDTECASKPAHLADWTGFYHNLRGTYCPGVDNNQLRKRTWHQAGTEKDELIWTPSKKIARLGPKTNIYGISTNSELLSLWYDNNYGKVRSFTLSPPEHPDLVGIKGLGGLDDGWGHGIFAVNHNNEVYNVYWNDGWIAEDMHLFVGPSDDKGLVLFGSHNGKTYVLHGGMEWSCPPHIQYEITRFDFVGGTGTDRYSKKQISYGLLPTNRRKLC